MVNFVMKFEIIENRFSQTTSEMALQTVLASFIVSRSKLACSSVGKKFYFQCEFHLLLNMYKNTKSFLYQKIFLNLFNFKGISIMSLTSHRA